MKLIEETKTVGNVSHTTRTTEFTPAEYAAYEHETTILRRQEIGRAVHTRRLPTDDSIVSPIHAGAGKPDTAPEATRKFVTNTPHAGESAEDAYARTRRARDRASQEVRDNARDSGDEHDETLAALRRLANVGRPDRANAGASVPTMPMAPPDFMLCGNTLYETVKAFAREAGFAVLVNHNAGRIGTPRTEIAPITNDEAVHIARAFMTRYRAACDRANAVPDVRRAC